MRVAIDTLYENPLSPTNATSFLRSLLARLACEAPWDEYYVLTSAAGRENWRHVKRHNVRIVECPVSNERRLRRIWTQQRHLPSYLKSHNIDLFHTVGSVLPLLSSCRSVLSICTLHHLFFFWSLGVARSLYRHCLYNLSALKCNYVIANSESNRRDIIRYLPITPKRVVVVPEALDPIFLENYAGWDATAEVLRKYHVARPYILFVSSLWRYKNLDTLIAAFSALVSRHDVPHELVVAGAGTPKYIGELLRLAKTLGVSNRLRLLGYVPHSELSHIYKAADVFVYPSLYETFGHPPLQAMACGTPVVAANCSSIPEVVGDAALLVNPRSPEDIANSIRAVISNRSLADDLRLRGKERIKLFSWDRTAKDTSEVYRMAMQ
jgi:glycosyltransferase involved in cell wall biosynthesis